MAKMFLFMMISLDGYFEGPNHDLSWHNADNQEFTDFADEQTSQVGTIVFGKRTYNMMASYWPKPIGLEGEPTTAKLMNETPKVVVTHNNFGPGWENTSVIHQNVEQEIKSLKQQATKDIAVFGSSNLCISLLQMGLLDELRIMISPVVIGAGTTLFDGIKDQLDLKLLSSRQFDSGNVLLTYKPSGI